MNYQIYIHPYNREQRCPIDPRTTRYDLAVLKLEKPVQYGPHIVPICLPPKNDVVPVGTLATVSGQLHFIIIYCVIYYSQITVIQKQRSSSILLTCSRYTGPKSPRIIWHPGFIHFRHGNSLLRLHGYFVTVYLLQLSKNDDAERFF